MITLFIDTSTTTLNVGLIKDDLLIDKSSMSSSEHSKYTMSEIEKLFKNSNIAPKSVDKIMVIDGPGSFTGVRIGVTIAKTYAWACKINVVPISTLKAYALSLDGYDYYIPLIDARRGYVYGAIYDKNYDAAVKDTYVELDKLKSVADNLENVVFISNDKFNFALILLISSSTYCLFTTSSLLIGLFFILCIFSPLNSKKSAIKHSLF